MGKEYLDKVGLQHLVSYIKANDIVAVSETEPTNENIKVWINASDEEIVTLPLVNDETINSEDTWSSQKISEELTVATGAVYTVLSSAKTYTDEQVANYEFITTDDIDTICGTTIQLASEVTF